MALQRRLKDDIKQAKAKLKQEKIMNKFRFYCVIDFEATCEKNDPKDYVHEIIEFPAVLLNAATLEKVCKLLREHLLADTP